MSPVLLDGAVVLRDGEDLLLPRRPRLRTSGSRVPRSGQLHIDRTLIQHQKIL